MIDQIEKDYSIYYPVDVVNLTLSLISLFLCGLILIILIQMRKDRKKMGWVLIGISLIMCGQTFQLVLETSDERYMIENVMLYGVEPDSRYVRLRDGVSISSAFADKDEITPGDTVTLKEAYGNEVYSFRADQVYPYDGALAIFMDRAELNGIMGEAPDYFCGYLSDTEITDIDEKYIGSVITLEDLTKISRQLDVSMGGMMVMVDGFAMIIFMILIYLLSKIVIEKNAQAISMTKILGYSGREISRLYILPTTLAVIVFLLISLPAVEYGMRWIFRFYMVTSIAGWIPYYLDPKIFAEMFLKNFMKQN